jgi:hypothetical protein
MKASELYNQTYYIKYAILTQLSNLIYSSGTYVTREYDHLFELMMATQVDHHLEILDRRNCYGRSTRLKTREHRLIYSFCSTVYWGASKTEGWKYAAGKQDIHSSAESVWNKPASTEIFDWLTLVETSKWKQGVWRSKAPCRRVWKLVFEAKCLRVPCLLCARKLRR